MSARTARFVLLIAPSGTCYIQGPTLDSYFGVLFIDGFEMAALRTMAPRAPCHLYLIIKCKHDEAWGGTARGFGMPMGLEGAHGTYRTHHGHHATY